MASGPSNIWNIGFPCDEDHEQQIDNSATILEKIAGLYAERLLNDITLEVGGKSLAAHRLILCASSDVFEVMLMNPNWSESQENKIILQEDPECVEVFPDFLKYMYTGKIHIKHELVLPLVTLADKYNIKDLVKLCVDYMVKQAVSAAKHNLLIKWLQYSFNCNHKLVYDTCFNFSKWNFEFLAKSADFSNLDSDVLITFLCDSDLVVKDEFTLFNCITSWLQNQESKMNTCDFDSLIPLVMEHIRFPMMSPKQLAFLLMNPYVMKYKEFFVSRMSLAMKFHSNKLFVISLEEENIHLPKDENQRKKLKPLPNIGTYFKSSMNEVFFTPRLYTTEKWSSALAIENYTNMPIYGLRTLVFQTPCSFAEWERKPSTSTTTSFEWVIDVYPKGVWFKKFFLIVWQGTLEMPEWVAKTVRLSVTSVKEISQKVSIGVLIFGRQDGVEYVEKVVEKKFEFTKIDKMVNFDDLIPFEELNSRDNLLRRHQAPKPSSFLVGPDGDTLKLQIIITPLLDMEGLEDK